MKWDIRFFRLAQLVASWSKDPSTKTGAVLVRPDRTVASLGYNGFAQGMKDDDELYADRETKYSRIVHCEMNALLFCRDPRPLAGFTLYTTIPCCDRCAVHMLQAGIRRFVWGESGPQHQRWNFDKTKEYLREAGASWLTLAPY